MNKNIILPVIFCTILVFTSIPFSFQQAGLLITHSPTSGQVICPTDNNRFEPPCKENVTPPSVDNGFISDDGIIEPGDNKTIPFKGEGGGYIYENCSKNNFGFNVHFNTSIEGHVNYIDRVGKYHFKSLMFTNATLEKIEDGYIIQVYGVGEIRGQIYIFRLEVSDQGEPAWNDTFNLWIYMEDGQLYDYSGGVLAGGNINIKPLC
ncbi:MAG: post-COAP-1 domain-containing protein [Candidatus Odinarchaeota archaeon]